MSLDVDIVKIYQVREGIAKYNCQLSSGKAVVEMIYPLYKDLDREVISVVGLNVRNIPTTINQVSVGSLDRCTIHPREVFKPLILSNSAGFVLVHNHPSNYLEPSNADIGITKRLKSLSDEMEIELVDSIILGTPERYYSMREKTELFNH